MCRLGRNGKNNRMEKIYELFNPVNIFIIIVNIILLLILHKQFLLFKKRAPKLRKPCFVNYIVVTKTEIPGLSNWLVLNCNDMVKLLDNRTFIVRTDIPIVVIKECIETEFNQTNIICLALADFGFVSISVSEKQDENQYIFDKIDEILNKPHSK